MHVWAEVMRLTALGIVVPEDFKLDPWDTWRTPPAAPLVSPGWRFLNTVDFLQRKSFQRAGANLTLAIQGKQRVLFNLADQ